MKNKYAEYKREWNKKNKEKVNAYQKKYRQKNSKKKKQYDKEWRLKNREKRNAQARREYAKRADHYTSKVLERLDRKNPARIIRRLTKQFRSGDIDRDELINGIHAALDKSHESNE